MSSILAFRREALPTLRYFPNDTKLALGMTFWNCTGSYKDSVSVKKMGEGWTGGASDIVKAKSSGEDPRATGDLVSNLPHPRVNKTKQHKIITFVPSSREIVTFLEVLKKLFRNLAASHRNWNVTFCDENVTSHLFVTVPTQTQVQVLGKCRLRTTLTKSGTRTCLVQMIKWKQEFRNLVSRGWVSDFWND